MEEAPLLFHLADGPDGWLSNFSPHPIRLDGLDWPTSEHWFQAQKFAGRPEAERIRLARSPRDAAALGWALGRAREDWEAVKEGVMLAGLRAKFTQHGDLGAALLATGDRPLVDHTSSDAHWGDGGDGSGANRLGVLLMQVRSELRG